MAKKGGLGKGLDALFVDNETADSGVVTLRLSEIEPNKEQPRKHFDDKALEELADSIREHGVLQPLLVRPLASGSYQLIAGERRWRASRMAGLQEVPVVISEMDDQQAMEAALIENLQREDLNPLEEARGYKTLMDLYGLTQEQAAKRVGKSRPVVANALRLLSLPDNILEMVAKGEVSAGHARALLSVEEPQEQQRAAQLIREGKLSVRDVERLSKKKKGSASSPQGGEEEAVWNDSYYTEMELALQAELGRKVKVIPGSKKDTGVIEVPYYNRTELADLAARLAGLRRR